MIENNLFTNLLNGKLQVYTATPKNENRRTIQNKTLKTHDQKNRYILRNKRNENYLFNQLEKNNRSL